MTVETYGTADPNRHEPDRDRWGRPLVIPPGGGKPTAYTRCTTYVDCLDDKWNLQKWQQRMVALGLTQRRDLLMAYSAIAGDLMDPVPPKSAKSKADAVCEQAIEAAQGSAAASIGTALHALTERLDRGLELGVIPDEAHADLRAYETATKALAALHIEQFTVQDELQIGGTPDRVVEFDGARYIADLKTGSIEYSALKIAMQLAVYAHSELYDVGTGVRERLPDVDQHRGIVIHLPAGTGECTLHWVDIAAGWEAVQVATQVRDWRKRGKGLLSPVDVDVPLFDTGSRTPAPAPKPAPEPAPAAVVDDLADRVASAESAQALTDLWSANKDRWTPHLTDLASARKRLLAEA